MEEQKKSEEKSISTLVVIGSDNSGKTSIINGWIHRATNDLKSSTRFESVEYLDHSNVGEKEPGAKNDSRKLILIDSPNSKARRHQAYPRIKASCVVLVCDISSPESRNEIPAWLFEAKTYYGGSPIILIGNKEDIASNEDLDAFKLVAENLKLPYNIVSAKEGKDLDQAFQKVVKVISEKVKHPKDELENIENNNKTKLETPSIKDQERGDRWGSLGLHYYAQQEKNSQSQEAAVKALHCFLQASKVDRNHPINSSIVSNLLAKINGDSEGKKSVSQKIALENFEKEYDPEKYISQIKLEESAKLKQAALILNDNYVKKGESILRKHTQAGDVKLIVEDIVKGKITFFSELKDRLKLIEQKNDYNPKGTLSKIIKRINELESREDNPQEKPHRRFGFH